MYGRWVPSIMSKAMDSTQSCNQGAHLAQGSLAIKAVLQSSFAIKAVLHTWHPAQQWRNRTRAVHERVESLHLGARQAEAARHRDRTRVPTDVYTPFFLALILASPFFLYFFQRF